MNWYAVFVETGFEEFVCKLLRKEFEESFLTSIVPKRKLTERRQGHIEYVHKVMFPGYVLLKTNMNIDTYYKLKQIPKFFRLLWNRRTTYKIHDDNLTFKELIDKENDFFGDAAIPNEEIAPLLKLLGKNDIIDLTYILVENSSVIIKSGPLKGLEGIIRKIDKRKKRAKIMLKILGTERIIDVGIEMLSAQCLTNPLHQSLER